MYTIRELSSLRKPESLLKAVGDACFSGQLSPGYKECFELASIILIDYLYNCISTNDSRLTWI